MIRERGENFRRWKRNVVEKADLVAVTALAQRLGQRQQMEIMHPDNVVAAKKFVQFRGKALVDPHIAAEVAAREFRQVQPVMQNRPEHPVGISIVIFLEIFLGEVGHHIGLMTVLNGAGGHVRCGGDPPAPAKPDTGMTPQDRVDRDRETARSASAVAIRDFDTIGDYDQPFHFALRRHIVPRTRSSRHNYRESDCELRVQSGASRRLVDAKSHVGAARYGLGQPHLGRLLRADGRDKIVGSVKQPVGSLPARFRRLARVWGEGRRRHFSFQQ